MTKKELEAELAALRAEVAMLRAQIDARPIIVNVPTYQPAYQPYYPSYPTITCTTTTLRSVS